MKVRPAAATSSLLLTLAACAETPVDPGDGGGIDHSTSPDHVLVRISSEGGFTPVEWTYTNFPFYSLYGDGTLVVPGAQIEIYPGPALPAISSRQVDEAGIQAILEEAIAAVEDVPADLNDLGYMSIADASTTVITVSAGGVDRTIRAYALSEQTERPDGMPRARVRGAPAPPGARRQADRLDRLDAGGLARPRGHLRSLCRPPVRRGLPSRRGPRRRSRCRGRSTTGLAGLRRPRSPPAGTGAASCRARTGTPSTRPRPRRTRSPPGRMRASGTRSCSDRCCPTRRAAEHGFRPLRARLSGPVKSRSRTADEFREESAALPRPLWRPMTSEIEAIPVDPATAPEGFFDPPAEGSDDRLRQLELRYRGIIDRLPAVLYVDGVAEDEPMIDVSPSVTDLLGIAREEFLSRPYAWADTIHPDDLDRVYFESERSVATGEPFRTQYRAVHRDGRIVWVREEAVLVSDDDGRPLHWLGIDARRHGADAGAGRAPRGQDEVRRAGGADPGDRLRRRRGRGHVDDLREPADRGDPRLHRAGVHRRPAALGADPPPGRSGERDGRPISAAASRAIRSSSSTGSSRATAGRSGSGTARSSSRTRRAAPSTSRA